MMMHTYNFLDLTPLGRNEDGQSYPMEWVRHHDRYETAFAGSPAASCCGQAFEAERRLCQGWLIGAIAALVCAASSRKNMRETSRSIAHEQPSSHPEH